MKLLAWFASILLAPLAFAAQEIRPAKARQGFVPKDTCVEIWRAARDFQRRLDEHGPIPDPARDRELQRKLDASLRAWWLGHGQADLAKLAEATRSLRKTPEPAAETVARSLRITPNPLVAIQGGAPRQIALDSNYPTKWEGPQSLEIVVRASSPAGTQIESTPYRVDPGGELALHAQVELAAPPEDAAGKPSLAGVWKLEIVARAPGAEPVEAGVAWVVPRSLDELRRENAAKLAELGKQVEERRNTSLSGALATLIARNELLSDQPDPNRSAQFRIDPLAYANELRDEMRALAAGTDPYRLRVGDLWRPIPAKIDGAPAAARVFAPSAAAKGEPLPLVIALGTFGSDENTLLDLMAPRLVELAEEKGFLLATLRVCGDRLTERRFDVLFNELGDDYPIDGKRVYFLGHASGAAQLGYLLPARGERVAAFASLGSADVKFPARHVPTLLLAASADEYDSPSKLELESATLRNLSSAVVLETLDGPGWWRLPQTGAERALSWLFERALP